MIDIDSLFFQFNVLLDTAKNLVNNPETACCMGYFLRYVIDMCHHVNLILQQDTV